MVSRVLAASAALAVLMAAAPASVAAQTSVSAPWVSQSAASGVPAVMAGPVAVSPAGDIVAPVLGDGAPAPHVILKLSASGAVVFRAQLAGTFSVSAVALAADGNIFVTGIAERSGLPVSTGAYRLAPAGDGTPYLCRLSGIDGSPLYCTYLSDNLMRVVALSVDPAGNAYVAAWRGDSSLAATPGAVAVGNRQVLVMKIDAAGSRLLFAAEFGGSGNDFPLSMLLDSGGNVYVMGLTTSSDFPGTGNSPIPGPPSTATDAATAPFAAKLSPDGSRIIYALYGRAGEVPTSMATGSGGEVHLLVSPPTTSVPRLLVRKYSGDGTSIVYATPISADWIAQYTGLGVDDQGVAAITGSTSSVGFPIHHATAGCPSTAGLKAYLVRLGPSGEILQATFLDSGGPALTLAANVQSTGGFIAVQVNTGSNQMLGAIDIGPGTAGVAETVLGCYGNGADFQGGPLAPGEIFSLFGEGLGPETAAASPAGAGGPAGTSLGGVTVTFDGTPAPLLYVQSAQINAVAPWNIAGKSAAQLCVSYGDLQSCTNAPVSAGAPGIFRYAGPDNAGLAAAVNQDGTLNSPAHPAPAGSIVSLYATGLGALSPAPLDGALIQPPLPVLSSQVQASFYFLSSGFIIPSIPATVTYAGPAPFEVAGMYQINVRFPVTTAGLSGALTLTIQAPDGSMSWTNAVISLR